MSIADKYRIIEELGDQKRRKFGRVFLIEDKLSGHKYVLKTIKKSEVNEQICYRLRHEATFTFPEKGLPKVIDFIETEEEILLILQFHNGVPLDVYWKTVKKKDQHNRLLEIVESLLPHFEFLRLNQIVHADIKPSNIIIDTSQEKLNAQLIDFGLALDLTKLEQNRKLLFPLGFAAPELVLNQLTCVNHTTDIYAFGILIWKLYTGKLPLTHPNPSIFTNLQITHPLPADSRIPNDIMKILSKMCFKHQFTNSPNRMNPLDVQKHLSEACEKRYQSLPEVWNDLKELKPRKNWFNTILFGNLKRN